MVRTPCCEKTGLKRGAWTPEEDKKLTAYIKRYGHWNWRELPKFAGLSRCGKSCRLRWMNYLRPNIKRGNYSREEEELIINLQETLGNRWSAIAANLPGRTDNEIKNHWHTHLKKRLKQNQTGSEEEKLHSKKISKCEANWEKRSKSNSNIANGATPPILESSSFVVVPLSPEQSSSDSSSSIIDSVEIDENKVTETNINSSETLVDFNQNFWTEPFLVGDSFMLEDISETLPDPGFHFPLSLVSLGESLCSYGSDNADGMDFFFNHLMAEELLEI